MSSARCLKIGLTGSIGMGKSTVTKQFRFLGIPVFDADDYVHKLYGNRGKAVKELSGIYPEVIVEGSICRQRLSGLIQKDPSILKTVESIVHPLVQQGRDHFFRLAERQHQFMVVYDIPLLLENPYIHKTVDYVVVVTASAAIQKERVLKRSNMTSEKLEAVLKKQMPDEEKRKHADFLIFTDRGEGYVHTHGQVAGVIDAIIKRNISSWNEWTQRAMNLCDMDALMQEAAKFALIDDDTPDSSSVNNVVCSSNRAHSKVLLLDLDDTMVDFSKSMLYSVTQLIEYIKVAMPKTFESVVGNSNSDKAESVFSDALKAEASRIKSEDIDKTLSYNVFELRRLALFNLAVRDEKEYVGNAMNIFTRARAECVAKFMYIDVLNMLQWVVQQNNVLIGVVTNGYVDLEVLRNAAPELFALINFWVQAAEVGAQKPSLVPFLVACNRAKSAPRDILFIGDSYSKDVLPARRCGMKSVWLLRPLGTPTVHCCEDHSSGLDYSSNAFSVALHDEYHHHPELVIEDKLHDLDVHSIKEYLYK